MSNPNSLGAVTHYSADLANRPSPLDLVAYLPWACNQMQCQHTVTVIKVTQTEYVSVNPTGKKPKPKPKPVVVSSTSSSDLKKDEQIQSTFSEEDTLKIYAIYDATDRLVELKFENHVEIPRMIFQIIALIIKFQSGLNTITINYGIDMYSIHEISKILTISNITDICLDDTYLKEANYYILLDNENSIRRISLSRCTINDNIAEAIAVRLVYPLPASKTLSILDLSSNKITDLGAKYIAHALRSNRFLSYLNLSGNLLTDTGAIAILNHLVEFQLTSEELMSSRQRFLQFYHQKNELTAKIFRDFRTVDSTKDRRKSLRTPVMPKKIKTIEREPSTKEVKSAIDITQDRSLYEKARNMAENQMGKFKDPFTKDNLVVHDDNVYCTGNNGLCYLNLSFNDLSYFSLKTVAHVVMTQKVLNKKPIGLVNVSIDGNNLPINCVELNDINNVLFPVAFDKNAVKKRAGGTAKSTPPNPGRN
ncbi:uncharacterized protein LOC128680228 [Plodia interpunctella]|uniref:uncharacterized protein LOC128680228 n=1 Tax=Plodia interpunctella TaxID=58824 RepID=UPI002368174D|nr:uncharacterized protein LOC128680228 [Plodia interpunctella]